LSSLASSFHFCLLADAAFFGLTRTASILPPRPFVRSAVARSGGQGRRFFSAAEGSSLTDASTAARYPQSGSGSSN
jgi:hypothetical protein